MGSLYAFVHGSYMYVDVYCIYYLIPVQQCH